MPSQLGLKERFVIVQTVLKLSSDSFHSVTKTKLKPRVHKRGQTAPSFQSPFPIEDKFVFNWEAKIILLSIIPWWIIRSCLFLISVLMKGAPYVSCNIVWFIVSKAFVVAIHFEHPLSTVSVWNKCYSQPQILLVEWLIVCQVKQLLKNAAHGTCSLTHKRYTLQRFSRIIILQLENTRPTSKTAGVCHSSCKSRRFK